MSNHVEKHRMDEIAYMQKYNLDLICLSCLQLPPKEMIKCAHKRFNNIWTTFEQQPPQGGTSVLLFSSPNVEPDHFSFKLKENKFVFDATKNSK